MWRKKKRKFLSKRCWGLSCVMESPAQGVCPLLECKALHWDALWFLYRPFAQPRQMKGQSILYPHRLFEDPMQPSPCSLCVWVPGSQERLLQCVWNTYYWGIAGEISRDSLDLQVLYVLFLYFPKVFSHTVRLWLNIASVSIVHLPRCIATWKTHGFYPKALTALPGKL